MHRGGGQIGGAQQYAALPAMEAAGVRSGDFEIVDNAVGPSSVSYRAPLVKINSIYIRMDDRDQLKRDAVHCSPSVAAAASIFRTTAVHSAQQTVTFPSCSFV